jgi:hypothetical protein
MKTSLAILMSAALTSQAALVYFDISPSGSDAAVGLNPANVVPAVTNSTGSGGSISAGVVFDTDTSMLQLAIGYGSAAGFTDLSGPVTLLSINGPATVGQGAGVLFDLSPYIFPAVDPAKGGIIFGSIAYPTNAVADLLAGLNYVSLSTVANPTGEIRGQLFPIIPTNHPPVVSCPDAATVECGTEATVTVVVSDPDGDALTVLWTVNGMTVQTNKLLASNPPAAANVSFAATLPLGTNIVGVAVTDNATNTASCSTIITVVDTTPPVIHTVSAKPNALWPPNHKMIKVAVNARVTDSCSLATWKIIGVQSNEPENGLGDGDTAPDWQSIDNHSLKLRAERSGKGTGRIYTITIQAEDSSGNLSEPKLVTVTVPKSQGKNPKDSDKSQSKRF